MMGVSIKKANYALRANEAFLILHESMMGVSIKKANSALCANEAFLMYYITVVKRGDALLGYKGRDVEVIALDGRKCLVAACDSCGGAGSKEFDVVKVPPYITGRFTSRVSLLEILATAAKPLLLTVASCSDPHPTTTGILEGVKDELKSLNLSETPVVVSSEKNIPTSQTGLGITVVGICERESLRIATSLPGDELYCLGLPKVGSEVVIHDDLEIAHGTHILELLTIPGVHDIIPVGSRGIRKEAESLASELSCLFVPATLVKVNLDKSAGPSTCLIFTCTSGFIPPVFLPTPIFKIGRLQINETQN